MCHTISYHIAVTGCIHFMPRGNSSAWSTAYIVYPCSRNAK